MSEELKSWIDAKRREFAFCGMPEEIECPADLFDEAQRMEDGQLAGVSELDSSKVTISRSRLVRAPEAS